MEEGFNIRSIHDDTKLITSIAEGDENAFALLYQRHWRNCFRTAFNITGREELAEDIVQELFINIWENRTRLVIDSPAAYLQRAARNQALNSLRHVKADDRFYVRLAQITSDLLEENPQFISENQELMNKIIGSLPEYCREVFYLSRIKQLSYQEIAQRLAISPKTVEKKISAALRHIRENAFHYILLCWMSGDLF